MPAGICTPSPLSAKVTAESSVIPGMMLITPIFKSHNNVCYRHSCSSYHRGEEYRPAEKTVEPRRSVKASVRITAKWPTWPL